MNTRLIQSISSVFLGIIAFFCILIPDLALKLFEIPNNDYVILMMQILGGLFLGFSITNWASRTILIGGIYGRAIYLGNMVHFLVGGLALLKWNIENNFPSTASLIFLIIYLSFALLYSLNLFFNPKILWKDKQHFGVLAIKLKS
ncbi:hypothetical protein [Flavobacterium sp. I3-2]|uniref:hypothetical protein n=1 Tax=Flavobacterium sp. I3-2 TaxID=2748319 RepID=UPI0015A9FE27|nr:hypothetical protein [Flavobacterium sp. I3-2]